MMKVSDVSSMAATNDARFDPRFYRKKYNAERALAQFAATVRDEVDMDMLTTALMRVVEETMQPERVSLWLRGNPKKAKHS